MRKFPPQHSILDRIFSISQFFWTSCKHPYLKNRIGIFGNTHLYLKNTKELLGNTHPCLRRPPLLCRNGTIIWYWPWSVINVGGEERPRKRLKTFLERLESVNGNCYKRRVWTGECALVPMGNYKSVHPPFIFACQQLGLLPPVANIWFMI